MAGSGLILTGATGFVGRHVLDAFAPGRSIWAMSRWSPALRGVLLPAGVRWLPVDIADAASVREAFDSVKREGGADTLIHLAGHYDFTGERHEEYLRTNVTGTRNVLAAARDLGVQDVVFASSVAACGFPAPGGAITEDSAPDGDTPYAESKRAGEDMLAERRNDFRGWSVRFAALYSDWCEYEPLFRFMESWLSGHPSGRIVAGRGSSAVPYMHVRDAVAFLRCLLARREELGGGGVLVASPDGATTHRELFEAATGAEFGERLRPILVPGAICRPGLRIREVAGRAVGLQAFERPWMGRMIDKQLRVDSVRTRSLLGWSPRPRLGIVRRMPFLVENRKTHLSEWYRRNHAALKTARGFGNLEILDRLRRESTRIAQSLAAYVKEPARSGRFPHLRELSDENRTADAEILLDALLEAVRTVDKPTFARRCRELAVRRMGEGIPHEELISALDILNDLCVLALAEDSPRARWAQEIYDHVTMTVQYGVDAILEAVEEEPQTAS